MDTRGNAPADAAPVQRAPDARLADLMIAAQSGDASAYRALLTAATPLIAAMARQRGIRGDAVNDIVQDTLLTIHRALATYDPERSFLAWLRAMTDRRAIDAIRREARRRRETHDPAAYEAHPDPSDSPWTAQQARERNTALAAAIARLPRGQREAVEHLSLRERSLDEAAALTGRTKGALKVDLHRALKSLRRLMGRPDPPAQAHRPVDDRRPQGR